MHVGSWWEKKYKLDTVQDLYTTREGEIMYIIPDRFRPVQAFFNGLEGEQQPATTMDPDDRRLRYIRYMNELESKIGFQIESKLQIQILTP